MKWTDERIVKLKQLWAEGQSASQIAAELGGVSRNAVIGKAHRLNLLPRLRGARAGQTERTPTPQRPARQVVHRKVNQMLADAAQQAFPVPVKEDTLPAGVEEDVYVPARTMVVPLTRRLNLNELTEQTCKWPVGDPLKDDFHFCGVDSGLKDTYCTYHARLAYKPSRREYRELAAAE